VWSPIAPFGRVKARFHRPEVQFSGTAYLDHNAGDEPLSKGFSRWTWSRLSSDEKTVVVYDVTRADGTEHHIGRAFHAGGGRETRAGGAATLELGRTGWRIARRIRAVGAAAVGLGRTLEDTPFYARSHLTGTLDGRPANGVHEVVDLSRFESPLVQALLPYRMHRSAR
jgi:carotenoid 1,2-hydratase